MSYCTAPHPETAASFPHRVGPGVPFRECVLLLACLGCALSGCSDFIDRRAAALTVSVIERSAPAMRQESDIELARRAIPSGLKTLEGLHVQYPDNRRLATILAETTCQFAAGFLQDEWEAAELSGDRAGSDHVRHRARGMFARCINYALQLLPDPWAEALWARGPEFSRLVEGARARDVPGMFFIGLGLAGTIGMFPEDFAVTARLPQAETLLERVVALDEGYAEGLAHMTLGILFSVRSAAVGGDPERGRRHFARAQALTSGRSLMIDVLMARYYAVTIRDRSLFRATLVHILQTAPSVWPEGRLSNELAQRKARRYLRHEALWFE